jgi:hypothetical protein
MLDNKDSSNSIFLLLTVTDGQRSSNVLSQIDILEKNDETPTFIGAGDSETLQISEDAIVGTRLLHIVVKDVDVSNEGVHVTSRGGRADSRGAS